MHENMKKVLTGKLTFKSLKPCDLSSCTKEQIREYFENSYHLNESLFTALKDEDVFYKCPERLRLPLIFYYGHTASVYVNKLILSGLLKPEERVNYEFETMFETGVDEMSWDDTENFRMGGKLHWPSFDSVVEYRQKVKELILQVIDETPLELPVTMENPWWGLFMCMEHERIHLETSSVLIRQLPVDMVKKPSEWTYAPLKYETGATKNIMISVAATEVMLGKPENFPSFGWDNEYGQVQHKVPKFEASKYLISNKEFLQFIKAGGYTRKEFWTDEGWQWVQYRKPKHPIFWTCTEGCIAGCGADLVSYTHCKAVQHLNNGQNSYCNGHSNVDDNGHQGSDEGGGHTISQEYRFRCMFDVIDMPWDWPVETNYHEAKAFAMWKGPDYRLLCEAEHNVIRAQETSTDQGTKCDIIYDDIIEANLNMQFGSSTPVNMYPPNKLGFHDTMGNVWNWVEDNFNGFPGFETSYLYDDFAAATFDGSHNLILGGSWVATGDEASRFARYAFRRHFFQHAGFRIARTIQEKEDQPVHLPAVIITTPMYLQGYGQKENPINLNKKQVSYIPCESAYLHYLYDTPDILTDMLHFEYSQPDSYPVVMSQRALQLVEKYEISTEKAMHLGCSTGRGSFELAKSFDEVLGIDVVGRFVDASIQLKEGENLMYSDFDGFKKRKRTVVLDDLPVENVTFKQLNWLPNEVAFFDFILATNFDRVQNVHSWTVRFPEVLRQKGLLVIASLDQWNEEALGSIMADRLDLLEAEDLLFSDNGITKSVRLSVWKQKPEAAFIPIRDGKMD